MEEEKVVWYDIIIVRGNPKPMITDTNGFIRSFTLVDAKIAFTELENIENCLWGMLTQFSIETNTLKAERSKLSFIAKGEFSDVYLEALNKLAVSWSSNIDSFYSMICAFTNEVYDKIDFDDNHFIGSIKLREELL